MTRLLHIIGPQGSGKSTLAQLIVRGLEQQKQTATALIEEEAYSLSHNQIRSQFSGSAVVIVETLERNAQHDRLQSGDMIITLERG